MAASGAFFRTPGTNPLNLTTLGFLLSVFGIAYQMLEGD